MTFASCHGTGVVIGESSVIGDYVRPVFPLADKAIIVVTY